MWVICEVASNSRSSLHIHRPLRRRSPPPARVNPASTTYPFPDNCSDPQFSHVRQYSQASWRLWRTREDVRLTERPGRAAPCCHHGPFASLRASLYIACCTAARRVSAGRYTSLSTRGSRNRRGLLGPRVSSENRKFRSFRPHGFRPDLT
ncbi:hypothetical protein DENSPDRAFT_411600 [Dentipellis sp. KUC8613]|nr:hypothetical protein DENSPDRAFT_411600 [Dentipellis sp. KUC8613]